MRTELEDTLFHKYPSIFGDKDKPMTETAMCWGLECGDGWYDIIDTLCALIKWKVDNSKKTIELYTTWLQQDDLTPSQKENYESMLQKSIDNKIESVKATQVKEKFGTLRFYTDYCHPEIDALIEFAERMSAITCEICGNKGTINDGGWLKVRCHKHKEE